MEHGTITLALTIRDVEQLNVELENQAFRRLFITALRAIRRHGAIRYSVRGAMEAIMLPSVACQFNMSGRNRTSQKPTTTPQIKKVAFDRMDNIIDCIVQAYNGRPFDKTEIEQKYGGSPENRALWIIKSIGSCLIGAPDSKGQHRQVTKVTKARRIAKAVTRKRKGKSSAAAGSAADLPRVAEELVNHEEEEEEEEQETKTSRNRSSSRRRRRKAASSAAAGKLADIAQDKELFNAEEEEEEEEKKQHDKDWEDESDSGDNGQGDGSESPSQALLSHANSTCAAAIGKAKNQGQPHRYKRSPLKRWTR
jgi:hypothetical protein